MTVGKAAKTASTARLDADWPAPPGVHAFTTPRFGAGASSPPFDTFNLGNRTQADGDDPATVERNRRELVDVFGLPSPPRWLRQVHGTHVVVEPGDDEPEGDAALTTVPGTVLAILTADCLPVVFAVDDGSTIAAAHAGWPGLAGGVLEHTVRAMRVAPGRIVAWFGPAAGPQAYEIGTDVRDALSARGPLADAIFVATRPGHWHVDLYAVARARLAAAGVTRVHGGGLCTITDPARFFSHRRDRRSGRMATLAWMSR